MPTNIRRYLPTDWRVGSRPGYIHLPQFALLQRHASAFLGPGYSETCEFLSIFLDFFLAHSPTLFTVISSFFRLWLFRCTNISSVILFHFARFLLLAGISCWLKDSSLHTTKSTAIDKCPTEKSTCERPMGKEHKYFLHICV